nr:hypothetical protein [Tanacetum cinerariifolium]
MVKLCVDLNEPKDSSKTDKVAQNDMVVKLGYGVEDLMYCHFLIPSLGLDYGLHSLNVDVDVLEMAKYVKDYKIILVYVEHGSSNVDTSIFVTPKKGVAIAVDNHLRKAPIEIDSSPDVNRNLTLTGRSILGDLTSLVPPVNRDCPSPIIVECAEDPFEELDDILGEYAYIGKQITGNKITKNEITRNESTGNEITGKQMVVNVGNSSTVDDVLELEMLFETEGVGPVGKFKEVEVDANNESEEESDIEGDYTMDSDLKDLDYDPSMMMYPKHDTSIGGVDVQDDDLDVIDYDSFRSDLDDGIDSERRIQPRKLRRIGKQKNKANTSKNDNERVRIRCEGTILALFHYVATDNNMDKNVFSQTKGGPAIRENINSDKQNILGKDKTVEGKGKKVNTPKKVDKNSCLWTMLVIYTKECRWEVRTLIENHTCVQSRAIKACTSRFLADHVIKSLATNLDIPVRAVQDQMQKQLEVGVSKMKAFRVKRIASDIMTGSFRACGREILGLDGCFMAGPWPGQILSEVGVDANNGIYPIAYAIVEAECKASWCWFLNLLGRILGLIHAIVSMFPSAEHRYCVRHIHENLKSQFKGGVYKEMLWNAAKATSKGEFKKKMSELKSFNSDAYDWLMKITLEQ